MKTWLHGLVGAVIGGAATSGSMMVVDPNTFNLSADGIGHLWKLLVAGGIVSALAYLKQSPVPPPDGPVSMNKLPLGLALGALICWVGAGCMTSKVTSVDAAGHTNTVTVVNTGMLALDCGLLQGSTAATVSVLVNKYPNLRPPLTDAQASLDGILNGATTNDVAQVLVKLKATGDPVLTEQVTTLMDSVSAEEQKLLHDYGTNVAAQISIALTRAVDGGLIVGLGLTGK